MIRAAFILSAAFVFLAVLPFPASAAEDIPASSSGNSWLDRAHSSIEEDFSGTLRWFDRFFRDVDDERVEYSESSLQIVNDFRWDEADHFTYRLRVRARIRLPSLKGKWQLLISGENRGDPNPTRPEDPGNPGQDVLATDGRASTEIAYNLYEERNTILFLGAGVRIRTDPSVFSRVRFLHARELAYSVIARLTVTPYWDSRDGFGETNELDFWRPISEETLLRLNNFTAVRESENGWFLGSELTVEHRLSVTSGIAAGGSIVWRTRPAAVVDNYRVFARYRRNFLRTWLFMELEPDINWRWQEEDGSRDTILGGTVRIGVDFLGIIPGIVPW
jgi:hypothetical protein